MQPKNKHTSVYLFGVRIDSITAEGVITAICPSLVQKPNKDPIIIFTPNPEQLVLAQSDDLFRHSLNMSTFNIADGMGLVWADRLLSHRSNAPTTLKERVAGVDMMIDIARAAFKRGEKVFLLGGKDEVAEKAAHNLLKQVGSDRLDLCSWYQGAENIAQETAEEGEKTLSQIRKQTPKVLFVAFGAPWQEQWVMRNGAQLQAIGVRVIMVVGGAFDVLAGKVTRAPLKWRKIGLEWLWRLMHEPWRWRRQMRLVRFAGLVCREMVRVKLDREEA